MKISLVLSRSWIIVIGIFLSLSLPTFAEGGDDMLNQAFDLVHKAWNPGGETPSDADRTDWLTQAMKLAQNVPDKRLKGHRVKAVEDIKAALFEIQKGDPDNKVTDYIHDADSELREAIALSAQK